MPMWRPHPARKGIEVPPALEEVLAEAELWREGPVAWSAQTKQWYRGPVGSFALVVQDTGYDERLLRSRAAKLAAARDGAGVEAPAPDGGPPVRLWRGGGREGFRACLAEEGLCKVVVPLVRDGESEALARYNVILMGPAGAADEAYVPLIVGVEPP